MTCRVQVGLALAAGYLLGRTKKMKLALIVAGFTAARSLPASPSDLLRQGSDALRSSPELTKLVELARVDLVGAGRTAAIAAATNRMESMSDRLAERTSSLTSVAEPRDEEPEEIDEEDRGGEAEPRRRPSGRASSSTTARRGTRERGATTGRAPARRRTVERPRRREAG